MPGCPESTTISPPEMRIAVPASRVTAWVDGFARRHGELSFHPDGNQLQLSAADGSWAQFSPYLPDHGIEPCDPARLVRWACPQRLLAVLLLRRGGYAVGLARGERWLATRSGTRYVQGRTAAGGWSQQRYQRRRVNQADSLVETARGHLHRLLAEAGDPPLDGLVTGGDRLLLASALHGWPRPEAVPPRRDVALSADPRTAALTSALDLARGPSVLVNDVTRP